MTPVKLFLLAITLTWICAEDDCQVTRKAATKHFCKDCSTNAQVQEHLGKSKADFDDRRVGKMHVFKYKLGNGVWKQQISFENGTGNTMY